MKKRICLLGGLLMATVSVCSLDSARAATNDRIGIPQSWVQLPEDRDNTSGPAPLLATEESQPALENSLHNIFQTNAQVLATLPESAATASMMTGPSDLVPWHLELFTTDLSVTISGLVGVTTVSGNPQVQAYWRHQGLPPAAAPIPTVTPATLQTNSQSTPQDISKNIEPMIRVAMSTGKIQDEAQFRSSLTQVAGDFAQLTRVLEASTNPAASSWWVSGIRLDVTVSASGKVSFSPSFGGDVRLRFEWKRMQASAPKSTALSPNLNQASPWAASLIDFTQTFAQDLESLAQAPNDSGFQPASFRVGIGMSAKQTVWGVVKGGAQALVHVNFSRKVQKPVVYPTPPKPSTTPLLLVENNPSAKHLDFAKARGIGVEIQSSGATTQAVYQVDREQFRNGLKRAVQMSKVFMTAANRSSGPAWKVYDLKADFDLSVSGTFGLAQIGGLFSSEVEFINTSF